MNDTGLEIARALESGASEREITERLVSKYAIGADQARRDVRYVLDELTEAQFVNDEGWTTPRTRRLGSLYFHLTTRCNLSCPHCYVSCPEASHDEPRDMATRDVLRLIDEAAAAGARAITLSGGEPLLHPEIRAIIAHGSSKVGVSVLTNGTLIDGDWAAFLAEHDVDVQVSLDGSTAAIHDQLRGRGSFDRALNAVDLLQKAGLRDRLNFCTTLMSQNLSDLEAIIKLTERLGVPLVRFIPLRRTGTAETTWDSIGSDLRVDDHAAFYRYTEELREKGECSIHVSCGLSGFVLTNNKDDDLWCPAGEQLVIDTAGDVFPCVLLMRDEDRLGNIHDDSISHLCASEGMARFCDILDNRRRKIGECVACSWRNLCQGGCMGIALDHKGTVWDRDLFCDYRKDAYRRAFDRLLRS